MNEPLVKVTLHGELGQTCYKEWNIRVNSVGEAIRCIEMNTKKLYKFLLSKEQEGARYRVLINGEDFICDKKGSLELKEEDIKYLKNSQLMMNNINLKSIDIVPVLEGADSGIFTTIAGALLIATSIVLFIIPGFNITGAALLVAGLGLLSAGVVALLSKPPDFEDFRTAPNARISYLFNGPQNTTREGGPVPVGYGRLLVGSQVISAAYIVNDYDVKDTHIIKRNVSNIFRRQQQQRTINAFIQSGIVFLSNALDRDFIPNITTNIGNQ